MVARNKSFTLNTLVLDKRLKDLANKVTPQAIEQGLGKAGLQVMNDTIMEQPTIPKKEGWLRGSGSVFVNSRFKHESVHGFKGKANKNYKGSKKNEAVIGFNTPYAARLHEHPEFKFTEPSSGAKYLETKLVRYKKTYMKIISKVLKETFNYA